MDKLFRDEEDKNTEFDKAYKVVFNPVNTNYNFSDTYEDSTIYSENYYQNTSNSQKENNNQINIENLDENQNPNEITRSDKENKRGRKAIKENNKKKPHTKEEKGNINSKIKNNYHNFIIYFLNKQIYETNNNKQIVKFRKIAYEITNIRNKDENKKLLNNKIKDLCNYNISPKYKNKFERQNKITLDKIYPLINQYLEMTYKDFFNNVFLNENNNDFKYSFNYFIDKWRHKTNDNNYIDKLIKNTKNYVYNHSKINENKSEKTFLKKKRNNKKLLFCVEQK